MNPDIALPRISTILQEAAVLQQQVCKIQSNAGWNRPESIIAAKNIRNAANELLSTLGATK